VKYCTYKYKIKRQATTTKTRTSYCSYEKGHLSRAENSSPIISKFWTIDYTSVDWWELRNFVEIGLMGASPPSNQSQRNFANMGRLPMLVKYTVLRVFSSCFVDQAADHNSQRILWCTMAQKTSFSIRMCLLSIRSVNIQCKGVKISKVWPSREMPAKTKTFESTL